MRLGGGSAAVVTRRRPRKAEPPNQASVLGMEMVVVGRGTVWYKKLLGRLRGSSRDAGLSHAAEPPHQRRPLHGPALPRRPPLTAQWTGCPSSTPTSRFPFRESCTGSAAPATGQVQRLKRWSQCCSARTSARLRTMFSTLHPGKPCIPHPPASPSPRACDTTASERIVSDPQAPCTRSDAHANPRVPVASSTLSRTPRSPPPRPVPSPQISPI